VEQNQAYEFLIDQFLTIRQQRNIEQDERQRDGDIEEQRDNLLLVHHYHQGQGQPNECEKKPSPFQLRIASQIQKLAERRDQLQMIWCSLLIAILSLAFGEPMRRY
jgi:hypothetical protein